MPTEEQKDRKNEMRRLNRARKKEVISKEEPQEPQEEPQEPPEPQEDPEVIRKKIIADKRRASLALARTKKKTNSQNTKDEIIKVKEENIQLKELAKKKEVEIQAVIPEIVPKVKKQRPKKVQVPKVQQVQHEPSIDYLVDKSYGEKLQTRLRDNMLQRMMQDTFM